MSFGGAYDLCPADRQEEIIQALTHSLYRRYRAAGLPAREVGPEVQEARAGFPSPSFNLASKRHHVCGGDGIRSECLSFMKDGHGVTQEQILAIEKLLYENLFQFAVERPVG